MVIQLILFDCLDDKGKDGSSEFLISVLSSFVKWRNMMTERGL